MDNSEIFARLCNTAEECAAGTDLEPLLVQIRDVNETDEEGHSPLWYASIHNPNVSVVETLLKARAENSVDLVSLAVINNPNPDVALYLYGRLPSISQDDKNLLFLLSAAANTHDRLVRFFHEQGADIDTTMPMDLYLEPHTDEPYDMEFDELWLNDDQSVEQNALVVAIYENPEPIEMVRTLLELGVQVNAVDSEGYPVIIHALDDVEIVMELLAGGVDVNTQDIHGMTPLMHACAADVNDVALLLIPKIIDVNMKSNTGESALHYALGCHLDDNTMVVKALIEAGCNVNEPDGEGLLPLEIARFNYCSDQIIELLMKAGARMGEVS